MRIGRRRRKKPSIWKGMMAGAIGGAVGTLAMNYAHVAYGKIEEKVSPSPQEDSGQSSSEPATVKAAKKITEHFRERPLTKKEKALAGQIMHWTMGVGSGTMYGAVAAISPGVTMGSGLVFGATLWAVADEIAVPAAGLSRPPNQIAPSVHAEALVSHLVYGLVTELVRRGITSALD